MVFLARGIGPKPVVADLLHGAVCLYGVQESVELYFKDKVGLTEYHGRCVMYGNRSLVVADSGIFAEQVIAAVAHAYKSVNLTLFKCKAHQGQVFIV